MPPSCCTLTTPIEKEHTDINVFIMVCSWKMAGAPWGLLWKNDGLCALTYNNTEWILSFHQMLVFLKTVHWYWKFKIINRVDFEEKLIYKILVALFYP